MCLFYVARTIKRAERELRQSGELSHATIQAMWVDTRRAQEVLRRAELQQIQ